MLSGELAVDPSNAGTTGLLDLTTRDWKPALLDMAGLRADIIRIHAISGRQFIRISWGWLIMD
ncbi:TPA: hypothetical protein ACHGIX_003952 [Escherichia coli]